MSAANSESTSNDADERLVEAFLTAYVSGDGEAIGELVTDDCILHRPRWPQSIEGRDAIVANTLTNEGSFTDVAITVEQSVVSSDRIGAYVTARGRNVGPLRMADDEIAPTGRRFEVPQFGLYRLEGDRVAEAWVLADALGIVEQLDNLPKGPGAMLRIALRQLRWRVGGRKSLAR